jgi:hypothetical protein
MEHIAIMRKSWGLTRKIISGEKTIESRWYKSKRDPWDRIHINDIVYFKDSGEPITIRCGVSKVVQFSDIDSDKVMEILKTYGKQDGIDAADIQKFYGMFKDKRYCLLIFLKDIKEVEPFYIDKRGFGAMASWITLDKAESIKSA